MRLILTLTLLLALVRTGYATDSAWIDRDGVTTSLVLTPANLGAATTAQGAKADSYLNSPISAIYSVWGGLLGDSLAPTGVQVYAGGNGSGSEYTGNAPLVRIQGNIANTTTPSKRGDTFEVSTNLTTNHMQKWSDGLFHLVDSAVGNGDHSVISAYGHAARNRDTSGAVKSTGGDMWGFHAFLANQGFHANAIAAELNTVNTDVDYLDDTPDGSGPNTSGYMQTALQIIPDGGSKHSTRAISIVPSGSIGYDTGITLRGHRSTGIYINSPITATRTDIKWGNGTSAYGLDLSAHTFSGDAIALGATQTIGDGTLHHKLSDLAAKGTLTSAKWCTSDGAIINCTSDAPTATTALSALTDATITSPATGQLLYYNGTKWVNSAVIPNGNIQITAGSLGIGAAPSARFHVSVSGGGTPTEVARFETTGNAGATRGPRVNFYGQNGGTSQQVAAIDGLSPSASNGNMVISTVDSGTLTEHLRLSSTGATITGAASATGDVAAKTFTPAIPAATTYGATTTIDLAAGDSPSVTLTGNTTLAFSNMKVGQWHRLNLIQDGTGSRTVTWPSTGLVCSWRNTAGNTAPTLLTGAGKVDTLIIHTLSTTSAECWTAGNK